MAVSQGPGRGSASTGWRHSSQAPPSDQPAISRLKASTRGATSARESGYITTTSVISNRLAASASQGTGRPQKRHRPATSRPDSSTVLPARSATSGSQPSAGASPTSRKLPAAASAEPANQGAPRVSTQGLRSEPITAARNKLASRQASANERGSGGRGRACMAGG
jgi:hypothetical protein